MDFFHITGSIGLFLGIYLQESSHFLHRILPSRSTIQNRISYILYLGLILELCSIIVLPLSTYVLLSSAHIAVFKHILIKDEKRKYSNAETFGSMSILSGCIIVMLFGGAQFTVTRESFRQLFDLYYYLYTFSSLICTLVLRRLGHFAGRIIVETGIPAQISSFAVAGMKIFWICADVFSKPEDGLYMFLALGVSVGVLTMANGFVNQLGKEHDMVIVMGGYYLWSICYSLPLSMFVSAGVGHGLVNYSAVGIGCLLIVPGIFLHSFRKIEYLKAYKENKYQQARAYDFVV